MRTFHITAHPSARFPAYELRDNLIARGDMAEVEVVPDHEPLFMTITDESSANVVG